MSLTGNKDTDYEILMLLSDKELRSVCQSNKKVNQICKDPNFWISKIIKKFEINGEAVSYLKHFLEFKTYKKLYKYLINVDIVEEKIQFISLGSRYDIDKLNKVIYPKYIDKIIKKFKINGEIVSYLNHFLEFKTYKKLYKYLINVDTVEEKIQFISSGGRYDIDKLNKKRDKAIYPKYIDKNLFFIDLKRKIFEQTIDGDEFLIFHDENIQEIYETEMKNLVESIINENEDE